VRQVAVTLSGYTLATPYTPAAANVSAPIYYGVGAPLRDHFLQWRARPHAISPCHTFTLNGNDSECTGTSHFVNSSSAMSAAMLESMPVAMQHMATRSLQCI